jgi:chromosome segregation ATPase
MKGVIKEKREEKARLVTALNNTTDQRKKAQLKGEIKTLEEGIKTLEKEKSTLDQRIEEGETTNSRTGLPFENIQEAMDQLPVDDTYKINEDIITNDAVVDHLSPERLRNIRSKAALPSNKLEEIKNKILRDEKGRPGIGKVREAIEETEGVIEEMKGVIKEKREEKVQLETDLINATDQQKVQLEGKIKTLGEEIETLGEEIETQEERGRVQKKNLDTILREQNLQQKTIMDEAVRHFWGVTEEERKNWLKANEKEDEEKKIITPPYTSKDYS